MYKLTIEQKQLLIGVKYDGEQLFNPIQDINGDWFISKEEVDGCTDTDFQWTKELVLSEYTPPIATPPFEYLPIEKLYFDTAEERDAFNAAEAEFAGADPSVPYLETGQDELGYYLLVDVVANPSLWQRFKNLF